MNRLITHKKVLVTGGAGFIGSNLVDRLLEQNNTVVCLDNFSTGKRQNLEEAFKSSHFTLIEGDIRNYGDCVKAVDGCELVLHQAALGSVPRSITDPMTTTDVNIGGFVKMLHAAKEAGIQRFVYAASSSTYGDHPALPKVEHTIGKPLSPYAITKYVDELFARNFSELYGIETIGLRYFNVFGRRQDPNGAYAAVIPKFVAALLRHESPVINGDGTYSRDFTYIENIIQANQLAAITPTEVIKRRVQKYFSREFAQTREMNDTISEVFNIAAGQRTSLNELAGMLRDNLSFFDPAIANIQFSHREPRLGDIPHSLASIEKGKSILKYQPAYSVGNGMQKACGWYWEQSKRIQKLTSPSE